MNSAQYNINFLVVDNNDNNNAINKINSYIKKYKIPINCYAADSKETAQEIIQSTNLDFVLIPERLISDHDLIDFSRFISINNSDKCLVLLQDSQKQTHEYLAQGNILIIDAIDYDLFKRLIGFAIINKDSFIRDTFEIKGAYDDSFKASYDTLTMLPNRAYCFSQMELYIRDAKHTPRLMALYFIDLDGFKGVNDKAGHKAGDSILQEVAKRLTNNTRFTDVCARFGGDEFLVFIPQMRNKEDCEIVAEKLLDTLSEPFNINNETWNLSASIGVAKFPDDGETADNLVTNADAAMYIAKQNGKNTVRYFNKQLSAELEKKFSILQDVREAIANNDFDFVLQPQHDLYSNQVIGVELFVRWLHPTKGIIMPNDFLPFLLNTGYINSLGDLIVKKALALYYELNKKNIKGINIAINVEARQFMNDNFVERIAGLKRLGVNVKALTIELTEDCFKTNFELTKQRLQKLKDTGVKICLDDFGLGNSSVSQLVQLPIDIVKIDNKLFYDNADNNAIKQGIISLAHGLNIKVMAKRIDNDQQLQKLSSLQCDYGQGYCYEKPMSFDDFILYACSVKSSLSK